MSQLSFKALTAEMKKKRTTNGYDVMVAYTESKVNELLKNLAESSKDQLTLGPFKIELYDDRREEVYYKTVSMQVEAPILRFSGVDEVILDYNVSSGTSQVDGGAAKPLAKGLIVQLKAKLCNALGTVDEEGKLKTKKDDNGKPEDAQPANTKIALNPNEAKTARTVSIDMSKVVASVTPKDEGDKPSKLEALALATTATQIQNHFQRAEALTYYLAGVSNTYAAEKDSHLLQPVAFNFSIAEAGTDEAALCMWIEVSGGSANAHESSTTTATFHPNERDCNPVPVGSTACVIIDHDLLWDQFLKPNISRVLLDLKEDPNTDADAFKANGKLDASNYYKAGVNNVDVSDWRMSKTELRDEISFSPKSPTSTFTISRGVASSTTDSALVAYKSDEQKVKWSWSRTNNIPPAGPPNPSGFGFNPGSSGGAGTVFLTYSWAARAHWTKTGDDDHPNSISLSWKGDPNWKVEGRSEEKDGWTKFATSVSGLNFSDGVPQDLVSRSIPAPTVDLHMNSLDYFLTTNLLCPGKHMFKADAIGDDEKKGLAVPHDLILTGEINTKV